MASPCATSATSQVTSTTIESWCDSPTSSAVSAPPAAPIVAVSSPVALDEAGASTLTVMEYPGLGAAMRRPPCFVRICGCPCTIHVRAVDDLLLLDGMHLRRARRRRRHRATPNPLDAAQQLRAHLRQRQS